MTSLHEIVDPWLLVDDSDDLLVLRDQLVWLQKHLFHEYEPSQFLSFDDRLSRWLENVPDGPDRRALFRLIGHLFFVAKHQFKALCRGAFNDVIVRWLLDEVEIGLDNPDLDQRLQGAVKTTWFCPVTDSMNINSFFKVNNLPGNDVRGDWRSLETLADPIAVRDHVASEGIERMVFLEDFVGSGGQMRSTVIWARHALPDLPMLFCPLICCPDGADTGRRLKRRFTIDFAPVLSLKSDLFLQRDPKVDEPELFAEVRDLIERQKHRLGDWYQEEFGHEETGAIFAMYSNCPDNTLPIIHEDNDDWRALFPRVSRE